MTQVKNKLSLATLCNKKTIKWWILLGSSISLMLIVTKNSPLFYQNEWVDLNAFLTMGDAWGNGIIPYRDIFEQKGPVLYVIFLIASKLSSSYFGIFVIESIFMFLTSICIFKIGRHFLSESLSLVFVFMSYIILTMTPFFNLGGSAEELSFVYIFYCIFLIMELQKNNFELTKLQYVISGLCLGLQFWTKYTFVGIWVGFYLAIAICFLIKKNIKELVNAILFSLLGFLIVTAPIILYFYANDALGDLFHNYFYANIKLYPSTAGQGFISKIITSIMLFVSRMWTVPLLFISFFIGYFTLIISNKVIKNNYILFVYSASYFSLVVTTLLGGKEFPYYFLILFPFACIPLLLVLQPIKSEINRLRVFFVFVLSLAIVVGTNGTIKQSKFFPGSATVNAHGSTKGPAQKKFAEIIKSEKNPTLLNYGSLDLGFYHASGVLPSNYYFEKQNIEYEMLPEMMDEQNDIINKKKVDFVVIRLRYKENLLKDIPKNIGENYSLVSQHNQIYAETDYSYLLFKKK